MDDDEKVDALISKNNGNTEPVGIMCVYSQSCISCIFKDVLQSRIQRRHQCAGRKAATPSSGHPAACIVAGRVVVRWVGAGDTVILSPLLCRTSETCRRAQEKAWQLGGRWG
jgi:hypothetical protein